MKPPNPNPAFQDWWHQARQEALSLGIAPQEVDVLIRQLTGFERWRGWSAAPLTALPELIDLWQRRVAERVPLQYLLGSVGWRDFMLKVRPGVLIPRPETELLVDLVAQHFQGRSLVDVGTGSGCLALGLARILPGVRVIAVDCDPLCLAVAGENSQALGLDLDLRLGSWLSPITELVDGVVSNPPYIPHDLVADLAPEVRDHEPWLALDGGPDGLMAFRSLADQARAVLNPGGLWAVEVMQGQAGAVMEILRDFGYVDSQTAVDLEGNARFVFARWGVFLNNPEGKQDT